MKFLKKTDDRPAQTALLFPGFPYSGRRLVRYLQSVYVFTILTADGEIIHHQPEDLRAFANWLDIHRVPSVNIS